MTLNLVLLSFWSVVWIVIKWIFIIIGVGLMCEPIAELFDKKGRFSLPQNDDEVLLLSVGLLFIILFGCLPYWGIFKWVLFAFVVVMAICSGCMRWYGPTHYIFAGLTIGFSCYLLVIPYWSVVRWIFLAIAGIAVCLLILGIIFAIAEDIAIKRRAKLTIKFQNIVKGLPISDNTIFDRKSEKCAKKTLKKIKKLEKQLSQCQGDKAKTWSIKKKLYEVKMDAFYKLSLRGEAQNNLSIYSPFAQQYKEAMSRHNYNILRLDPEERLIMSGGQTNAMKNILAWKNELENDRTTNFATRLRNIAKMNTEGFLGFTSTSKLSEQTQKYCDLLNVALDEAKELRNANIALNDELTGIRLTAYRNIYLGVELLNYLRDNAGGQKLTTEKGLLQLPDVPNGEFSIDMQSITLNYNNICNRATEGFNRAMQTIQDLGFNPGRGTSFVVGGLAAIGAGIMEHANAVSANREQQAQLVSTIKEIVPTIQDGQAGLLRTIEIMQAIVKTNNGFMKVYAPIRDKVFVNGGAVTNQDIQALTLATQEFKKISTTQL